MVNVINRETPGLISRSQQLKVAGSRVAADLVCNGQVVLEYFKTDNGYDFFHVKANVTFCVSFYDPTGTTIVAQYQTAYPAGQDASFELPYGLACGACG